ncbi:type II toxin-antitoxin system Phd/YefM family antitoxin [Paenibacillus humicola]|uniref:type II toxin-antitoxin system Phd/YefM family antitoxin n=1 Tax=Paenibacillus humicola TaxID=3110540 RepID=UPI00237A9305|nr:type II toxin-antitoxin system Phd/YefM family antitoxin [Paenibacillus humicola]
MAKPTFDVDQLITSSDAAKRFGELRKRAKDLPQYITDNGAVDSVLIGYDLFEQMYDRLTRLEQEEERRILLERMDRIERSPESAKSWKAVRRNPEA